MQRLVVALSWGALACTACAPQERVTLIVDRDGVDVVLTLVVV